MQPTSIKSLRRQIARKQEAGKEVPSRLMTRLDKAIELEPHKKQRKIGIPQELLGPVRKTKRYKVLRGSRFGKASKARVLTGEELQARKDALLKSGSS